MAKAKVLVIEDDRDLREVIARKLTNEGFAVTAAADGASALQAAQRAEPDLVILDLILPDVDGLELCPALRASSDVLILILTAKVQEADEVRGLELGADDYVTKPVSLRTLTARVRALLHRRRDGRFLDEPLPVGAIAPHAIDDDIWVKGLTRLESPSERTPDNTPVFANPGDFWRIDQRWHLLSEPEVPAEQEQLERSTMAVVDSGYIVEILGDGNWVGLTKEVYLYKATAMAEVDQPIAHGYIVANMYRGTDLGRDGHGP